MSTAPEPEHIKCAICGINDVPIFFVVLWCDQCMDELDASKENIDEFVKRKHAARTET